MSRVTCHVSRVRCHTSEHKVTCYNCREEFNTKVEMMDDRRDSDHPSKRKCTQDPECERGTQCWFRHRRPRQTQNSSRTEHNGNNFTCKTCQNNFKDKNELMFQRKREHSNNIACEDFLAGTCRRGTQGEFCWHRHDLLPAAAPNVVRTQLNLPPNSSGGTEAAGLEYDPTTEAAAASAAAATPATAGHNDESTDEPQHVRKDKIITLLKI